MGIHSNEGKKIKSAKETDIDPFPVNKTNGSTINHSQERLMIPVSACVFLGTVLVMLLILYIIKYCKDRRSNRDNDDVVDDDVPVTDVIHNHQVQNLYPPPYNSPYHSLDCPSMDQRGGRVLHQNYEHRRREIPPLWYPNYLQAPVLNQRQCEHGIRPNTGTRNPIFQEDSDQSDRESNQSMENGMEIRDLYKLTDRSVTHTICGKLVVSVTHLVDHTGSVLILDNMGISLKVPQGAIKRGQKQIIFLVLNWDLTDNPNMTEKESLVSPVVYVGPHGLKLNKPCSLIFRHCSYDTRHIRVMCSETELHVRKNWNVFCDQNEENSPCYLTPDECQLKIDTFTLYTCVQAPTVDQVGRKWLQIAAFACPLRKDINHHQIRVYFLNKTPCALQWAIQNEANFGGKMICPEKVFLFDGNALDMFAKTRYISEQWELVESNDIEKISFLKIWHGQCPHISLCFRRLPRDILEGRSNPSVAMEMNVHLFTYQNTREDDGEKIIIQICEDNVTPKSDREPVCLRHHIGEIVIDINPDNAVPGQSHDARLDVIERPRCRSNEVHPCCSSRSTEQRGISESRDTSKDSSLKVVVQTHLPRDDRFSVGPEIKYRVIPHTLRKQLKILLDAKHKFSSDWRDLAEKIGLDTCIPALREVDSPTEEILDAFENSGKPLASLQDILYQIGREDCASEVEKYMRTETKRKIPVEQGNRSTEIHSENSTGYQSPAQDRRSCRSFQENTFDGANCENVLSANTNSVENCVFYSRNIPLN